MVLPDDIFPTLTDLHDCFGVRLGFEAKVGAPAASYGDAHPAPPRGLGKHCTGPGIIKYKKHTNAVLVCITLTALFGQGANSTRASE